jgi:nucleoside-diphosphate-sugar epimerase
LKTILITGCSGFIGGYIAKNLAQLGFNVLGTARKRNNDLNKELGIDVRELDVLKNIQFQYDSTIDTIIHCATANDIYSKDFRTGIDLSLHGTKNILDFAIEKSVRNVMFFSTLQVYGTELNGHISSNTPINCETNYALNHWFGEELCKLYGKKYKINIFLIRPSNVYGIPASSSVQRASLVPTCFINEAIESGRIMLRSSGKQKRNFISLQEVSDACAHLLTINLAGTCVVNLGSQFLYSIKEIASLVSEKYFEIYEKKNK